MLHFPGKTLCTPLTNYMYYILILLSTAPGAAKVSSCPDPGSTPRVGHLVPGKREDARLSGSGTCNIVMIVSFVLQYM